MPRIEVHRQAMLTRVFERATRSRLLASRILGVELPPRMPGEHYFDVTTLGLIGELETRATTATRVLDMGTGSVAALGLWLWRHVGCAVTCTEVDPAIAARARASVALNGAPIEVVEGPYFEPVTGPFDLVVFNPPYVSTSTGERRGLPRSHRSQWDGGADGSQVLDAFLGAFAAQGSEASALVGLNRRHLPAARVEHLARLHGTLRVARRRACRWLPVDLYTFESRKSPSARTSSPLA